MLEISDIERAEQRLRDAMLTSDVGALDELLADSLCFTNHLGQRMSKAADLEGHRSGTTRIDELETLELECSVDGEVGIASAHVRIRGNFGGQPAEAELRYTRVWKQRESGALRVIAAHSSGVSR